MRGQFGDAKLPFIVVSLPDYAPRWGNYEWSWIRESQANAVAATPGTALALSINTTDGTDLHPKEKREIGRRAALLARRDFYGSQVVAGGPMFRGVSLEGAKARVTFDTGGDGLAAEKPSAVRGFSVAGEDGRYYFADASIDGESVLVSSPYVPAPKTVRYAWAGVPRSTLTNRSGLPAFPFRTDSLPPGGLQFTTERPGRKIVTAKYEATVSADGMVESLRVGGKQFLSFDAGLAGGTTIPFIFGARSLHEIRELGPTSLSCADNDVTLVLDFADEMTRWTIANRGKDEIRFRMALSPGVKVSAGNPVTLARGKATLAVAGADKVSVREDPNILEVAVPAGQSRKLELTVGGN